MQDHFLNPICAQCDASKEEPNSKVLAQWSHNTLAKKTRDFMVPIKSSPRSFLIRLIFHGVTDANGQVPSYPHNFASPKPMCNGLGDFKHTQKAFVINLSNKPNSPSVKGQPLILERPNEYRCQCLEFHMKCCQLWVSLFIYSQYQEFNMEILKKIVQFISPP